MLEVLEVSVVVIFIYQLERERAGAGGRADGWLGPTGDIDCQYWRMFRIKTPSQFSVTGPDKPS